MINQAQPYRSIIYPLGSRGHIQRVDPAFLETGQFLELCNMVSWQEGALRSRNGYRLLESDLEGCQTLTGLVNLREQTGQSGDDWFLYLGCGSRVYRLRFDGKSKAELTDPGLILEWERQMGPCDWSAISFRADFGSRPVVYFASLGGMFKDPLNQTHHYGLGPVQSWGLHRPVWPVQARLGGAGNLVSSYAPYSYVYTLRNPITGLESNPSPLMHQSMCIETEPDGSEIELWLAANSPSWDGPDEVDPQILGQYNNIVIYRAGGSFSDGLYRRIATITVNEPVQDIYFVDNIPDDQIINNPIAEFDNDPPVASLLPRPFIGRIVSVNQLTPGEVIYGKVELTLEIESGLQPGQDLAEVLSPGSMVTIGAGTEQEELCVIAYLSNREPPYRIITVTQFEHSVGESVMTSRRAGSCCRYVAAAFNSLFLAGDPLNPGTLYKSKPGRPECFPAVIDEALGAPGAIRVSSPSNPIMNITEFGGMLLVLCRYSIYGLVVSNGVMQAPQELYASRGLVAPHAWCKVDNELYYVSDDGIYAFSGGQAIKRSEQIDHIFRGEESNGFYPISLKREAEHGQPSDLERIRMWYHLGEVFLSYIDTSGQPRRLRYNPRFDRWSSDTLPYSIGAPLSGYDECLMAIDSEDLGVALALDNTPSTSRYPQTTDGWTSEEHHADGAPIHWSVRLGWMYLGEPALQKQIGTLVVELANPNCDVQVEVFYDFAAEPGETAIIPAAETDQRYRYVIPLNCAMAQEAWCISVRFSGSSTRPASIHTVSFYYLPLTEIQRGRPSDWDNLGYPYDKRLTQLSLEYDSVGQEIDMHLDVAYGPNGNQIALAAHRFTLRNEAASSETGPVRCRAVVPLDLPMPVKLVRLRSLETEQPFKLWEYHFDFIQYPPDCVLFTEWEDMGWPCDKLVRDMALEIDTGGHPCRVDVQVDGATRRSFYVRTDWDSRYLLLSLNEPGREELCGCKWRLVLQPSPNGKSQLFKHEFLGVVREPCAARFWSSYNQTFGYNGYKFVKQLWICYRSCADVVIRVYVDGMRLLLEDVLPGSRIRRVERVYLPVASADGVLNKSKTYSIELYSSDECCPLYHYADASVVEWMPVGADMRTGYQQARLTYPMERTVMI